MSQQATSAKKETATKKTTAKSSRAAKATEPSLNMQELRELAELVDAHGFTDFEFENETIRVRLSKQVAPAQIVQAVQPIAAPVQSGAPAQATTAAATAAKPETPHPGAKADAEAAADEDLYKIPSPIVGTFYRSPAPDKDPYIQIGSKVAPESVVCIIEAMKLMNEIQAEVSGEVVKIYVENGQPVEYGQPLFGIRK